MYLHTLIFRLSAAHALCVAPGLAGYGVSGNIQPLNYLEDQLEVTQCEATLSPNP